VARNRKSLGVSFGSLRRKKSDTNGVWAHLASDDAIFTSTSRIWRLPRWLLPFIGIASIATLVVLCVLVAGLYKDKPNVQQVVSRAREATVEITCGANAGTGVSMNVPLPDGYKTAVFTVAHVLADCAEKSKVTVTSGGRDYVGVVYRKDPSKAVDPGVVDTVNDIALIYLRVAIPGLDPAPAANAGDWAIVLGNPWDEKNYATFGIVSAVRHDEYATDAAVNPGNSGGPLLDSQGRVLGLMSYISEHSEHARDSRNDSSVLDADIGMSYAKRLRLTCGYIYSAVPNCPFKD